LEEETKQEREDGEEREDRLGEALELVAPWCMAQQFGTRVVAQVCFRRLWRRCGEGGRRSTLARLRVLRDCIVKSAAVNSGNHSEQRITEDFYLTVFCPRQHLTLADVLHHFPRLCGLGAEEVVPEHLTSLLPPSHLPTSSHSSLADVVVEAKGKEVKDATPTPGGNIQRKLTPWASLVGEVELEGGRLAEVQARPHPGLVLVASLVDKAPNLGGLARTCEILGVGSLVIANLAVTREKDFTATSVTAEKWVPLEECPPSGLPRLLEERRSQGWRIVAVEQAAESIPLYQYKFPEQTLLLLG